MKVTKNVVFEDFVQLTNVTGIGSVNEYKCRYCNKILKASSCTRLREHIDKRCKNIVYDSSAPKRARVEAGDNQVKICDETIMASSTRNDTASSSVSNASTTSLSLNTSNVRVQSFSTPKIVGYASTTNEVERRSIDAAIAAWVLGSNQPLSVTSDPLFVAMINTLRPSYTKFIPTRHTLSNGLLDKVYDEVKEETVKTLIKSKSIWSKKEDFLTPFEARLLLSLDPRQRDSSDRVSIEEFKQYAQDNHGLNSVKVYVAYAAFTLWKNPFCSINLEDPHDTGLDLDMWWIVHREASPELSDLATRLLSITTSSASSEMSWSAMENVHTKERNQLTPERVDKLTFINMNKTFLKEFDEGVKLLDLQ